MDEMVPVWLMEEQIGDAGDDYDTDDLDMLLSLMYVEYLYCLIYIEKITLIQSAWRRHRERKRYHRKLHEIRFLAPLHDIIEVSYSPPNPLYPLLVSGGCRYKEGLQQFINSQSLLKTI